MNHWAFQSQPKKEEDEPSPCATPPPRPAQPNPTGLKPRWQSKRSQARWWLLQHHAFLAPDQSMSQLAYLRRRKKRFKKTRPERHSWGTFQFHSFQASFFAGNSWFVKRTMVEKNGESTLGVTMSLGSSFGTSRGKQRQTPRGPR